MKKNEVPLISIILVNYNGLEDTIECVSSLLQLEYKNYEIIVVENASKDADAVKNNVFLCANCTLLFADENNGFSAGNNIGIRYALEHNADYVLLLNNDTTVKTDLMEELLKPFESDDVGITTGNIYYYWDRKKLWYSNGHYDRRSGITTMDSIKETRVNDVTFVCGCCMLISRQVLQTIGLLDEEYFLYSEDTAYCCKVVDAGWRLVCNQDAEVYHKVSASTKANSDFQNYYLVRNNLLLIQEVGTDKTRAVINRLLLEMKEVLRGREKLSTLIRAVKDAKNRVKGRCY